MPFGLTWGLKKFILLFCNGVERGHEQAVFGIRGDEEAGSGRDGECLDARAVHQAAALKLLAEVALAVAAEPLGQLLVGELAVRYVKYLADNLHPLVIVLHLYCSFQIVFIPAIISQQNIHCKWILIKLKKIPRKLCKNY